MFRPETRRYEEVKPEKRIQNKKEAAEEQLENNVFHQ